MFQERTKHIINDCQRIGIKGIPETPLLMSSRSASTYILSRNVSNIKEAQADGVATTECVALEMGEDAHAIVRRE